MTRKEAVVIQKAIRENLHETGKDFPYRDEMIPVMKESCDMAIKALEQESCEDCISREAVKELFQEACEMEMYDFLGIYDIPSVTPQPKNGKWLKGNSYGDQYNYYQSCVCSCCKREYDVHGWNYCPNCGAKMEVEE